MDKFKCTVCKELLYDPVSLVCGNVICRDCFPRYSIGSSLNCSGSLRNLDADVDLAIQDGIGLDSGQRYAFETCFLSPLSTNSNEAQPIPTPQLHEPQHHYVCPSSTCSSIHIYRQERQDTLISALIEKAWPKEYTAYESIRVVERALHSIGCGSILHTSAPPSPPLSPATLSSAPNQSHLESVIRDNLARLSYQIMHNPTLHKLRLTRAKLYFHLSQFGLALTDIFTLYKHAPHLLLSCWFLVNNVEVPRNYPVCFAVTRDTHIPLPPPHFQISDAFKQEFTVQDLECPLCLSLLVSPHTLPCGHTACKSCLLKCAHTSNLCPICRRGMPEIENVRGGCVNRVLSGTIVGQRLGPERDALDTGQGVRECIPIFVCALAFPGMTYGFHLFEPRYRRMIYKCMQTTREFGICLPRAPPSPPFSSSPQSDDAENQPPPFHTYGTIVRITHLESVGPTVVTRDGPLPRFVIEVVGVHRFKVSEWGYETECEGFNDEYMWGKVDRLYDHCAEDVMRSEVSESALGLEEEQAKIVIPFFDAIGVVPEIHSLTSTLTRIRTALLPHLSSTLLSPSQHTILSSLIHQSRLLSTHTATIHQFTSDLLLGLHPTSRMGILSQFGAAPENVSELGYWVAQILPVRLSERYGLLKVSGVAERLGRICGWIERAGC